MTQSETSEAEATQLLARRLTTILRDLPPAYERLKLFRVPGLRPSDSGSRQRHGDAVRDVLALAVEDLLNERVKPGTYPARVPSEIALDQVWDPTARNGRGDWVTARRQGVLPTLAAWSRLVDAELWDAGIEHPEYGLASCGRLCWLAPVQARDDNREGPCSEQPHHHWTRPPVPDECAWLTQHATWIVEQNPSDPDDNWPEDIITDLRRLLADIQTITGELEKPVKMTCLKPGCGWPVQPQDGGTWFKCTGCGKSSSRLELHRIAERKQPKTLTELAAPTGLSIITLRRYEDAGKITPLPERRGNAKQYDLDQVMQATQAERYKPQGRSARGRFTKKVNA
jgi:predicted RNA-binding Zn-ribbon protein involved in translation (DUF1610 family)